MKTIEEGQGELVGWRDPDEHIRWVSKNKSREMKDKRMTPKEAIGRFVKDGDFIASAISVYPRL